MKTGSWAIWGAFGLAVLITPAQAQTYPKFEVDPNWPRQMPHGYFFGQVAGLTVDAQDNVWVISRPRRVVPQLDEPPQEASGVPAPSVVALAPDGKFLRGWGGPFMMSEAERAKFEWPVSEHGIAVDSRDNVWICGNGRDAKAKLDDNQCLKFTHDGKFLHGKQTFQPFRLHHRTTDPCKRNLWHKGAQTRHQRRTQFIPGRFARYQE